MYNRDHEAYWKAHFRKFFGADDLCLACGVVHSAAYGRVCAGNFAERAGYNHSKWM